MFFCYLKPQYPLYPLLREFVMPMVFKKFLSLLSLGSFREKNFFFSYFSILIGSSFRVVRIIIYGFLFLICLDLSFVVSFLLLYGNWFFQGYSDEANIICRCSELISFSFGIVLSGWESYLP